MKRGVGVSDDEWRNELDDRKLISEQRMRREDNMKGFVLMQDAYAAARIWYGSTEMNFVNKAELRLNDGEMP